MVVKKLGCTRGPSWMVSAKKYTNASQLQAIIPDLGDVDNCIHHNGFDVTGDSVASKAGVEKCSYRAQLNKMKTE